MRLLDERRAVTYTIVIGIWAIVAVYALLHDLYIVRIAPEHFTIFHPPLWGLSDPVALASGWAFKASIGPGLVLGVACAFVARAGRRPRIPVGRVLIGGCVVVMMTEIVSAGAGFIAYRTQAPLYPEAWYPVRAVPILVTQTIQISCYLSSAVFSALFLWALVRRRRRLATNPA